MKWTEAHRIGIDKIDQQHQELFEIVDTIQDLIRDHLKDETYDDILKLLIKLNLYAVRHFETEEQILKWNDYPDVDEHKIEHGQFTAYLDQIDVVKLRKDEAAFLIYLNDFLEKWVKGHLIGSDGKYKAYLQKRIDEGTLVTERPPIDFKFEEIDD